eukprot:294732-Alexandrium_andersonii.AAC.1
MLSNLLHWLAHRAHTCNSEQFDRAVLELMLVDLEGPGCSISMVAPVSYTHLRAHETSAHL